MVSVSFAQPDYQARSISLGGAFSTLARGYQTVGYNPANLAYRSDNRMMIGFGGITGLINNNFYNLELAGKYGQQDFIENPELQEDFINDLPEDGWNFTYAALVEAPLLNISFDNKAFTSRLLYFGNHYLSRPLLDVIFGNTEIGVEYDLDAGLTSVSAMEYAFSMGVPIGRTAWGITIKYYAGMGYFGLNPDYATGYYYADTSTFTFNAGGHYQLRNSCVGNGYGLDIGFSMKDISGWDLSMSVMNIGAAIEWNKSNIKERSINNYILQAMRWRFENLYKNADFNFDNNLFDYQFQAENVSDAEQNGFLQGDSAYGEYFTSSSYTAPDSSLYAVSFPLQFRIGLKKDLTHDLVFVTEFLASVEDNLIYHKGWRCAVGFEYTHFKRIPMRVGLSAGGVDKWSANLGSGLKMGAFHFDWAVGFNQGLWLHKVKGLKGAINLYYSAIPSKKSGS